MRYDDLPVVLMVAEVASLLGLSRRTTYRMIASGLIPCVRPGPRIVRVPKWVLRHEPLLQHLKRSGTIGSRRR